MRSPVVVHVLFRDDERQCWGNNRRTSPITQPFRVWTPSEEHQFLPRFARSSQTAALLVSDGSGCTSA
jgi:hypothetical protein